MKLEWDKKIDNLACWHKQLLAECEAIKNEAKKMLKRAECKFKEAERVKGRLSCALNGQKFETARVKISWRKSEKVNILDENKIPDNFKKITITYDISKSDIKQAIKSGQEVLGAELIENNNIQIK